MASQAAGYSLLDYIPAETLIAVRDAGYTVDRIRAIADDDFSQSAIIAGEGDMAAMKQVVDAGEFARHLQEFRQLRFTASAQPDPAATASIDFNCSPQAIYHKISN